MQLKISHPDTFPTGVKRLNWLYDQLMDDAKELNKVASWNPSMRNYTLGIMNVACDVTMTDLTPRTVTKVTVRTFMDPTTQIEFFSQRFRRIYVFDKNDAASVSTDDGETTSRGFCTHAEGLHDLYLHLTQGVDFIANEWASKVAALDAAHLRISRKT